MGELLHLRLGALATIAALAAVSFPILVQALLVLERSGRLRATTKPSYRSLRTDLGYLLLVPLTELLSRTLTTLAIVACALLAGGHVGPELLRGFGPVVKQPRWLIVLEMLVLSDFIYYWIHRLAHTNPLLWRLHAVHHSTRHLRWTSAWRAHPAEVYLHLITIVPLFLLGFPVDALAPLAPFITLYALVIHCNVNVSPRRLSYVVNSPRYHGWHHALDAKEGGVNFAGLFPLFDALFGTYLLPEHLPADVGIDDPGMPETGLAQLKYPFRRRHNEPRQDSGADRAGHGDIQIQVLQGQ
jgi:sterol desaturase/sphingolipid hydroxylase (fatty acid hydroxylase superfamily)